MMRGLAQDIWWMLLFRGLVLLLFGIFAVIWPGITLGLLVLFFSIYVFIAGVINIVSSIGSILHRRAWFLHLILGIIEIGIGIFVVRNPGLSVATFILAIGILFIIEGIIVIIASFSDTRQMGMRVLEVVSGILAVLAGIIILRSPATGGLVFVWVIGAYGIIVGALNIALALSTRDIVVEVIEDIEGAVHPTLTPTSPTRQSRKRTGRPSRASRQQV